jgi:hypothetical protein
MAIIKILIFLKGGSSANSYLKKTTRELNMLLFKMICIAVTSVILASRVSNYSGPLSGETYLELWSTVKPSGIYGMLFGLKYIFRACATVFGSLLTLRKSIL